MPRQKGITKERLTKNLSLELLLSPCFSASLLLHDRSYNLLLMQEIYLDSPRDFLVGMEGGSTILFPHNFKMKGTVALYGGTEWLIPLPFLPNKLLKFVTTQHLLNLSTNLSHNCYEYTSIY